MITLSAALIVKNEERFLEGCLAALRLVADETVVVDTGSIDRTIAIAREMGARVFEHPWQGRFDDARNAALARCAGNWILIIDADERVRPIARAHLDAELAPADLIAARVHFAPALGFTRYREWRLYRNHPHLRFRGAIHETLRPAVGELVERGGWRVGESELEIDHLGYEGDIQHKHHRNLPILLREVAEDPSRVYLWSELGRAYAALGQGEEALRAWRQGLAVVREVGPRDSSYSFPYEDLISWMLDAGEGASAATAALMAEAEALFPGSPKVLFLAGRFRVLAGRASDAIPLFRRLLQMGPRYADPDAAFDQRIFGLFAYEGLALASFRLGDWAESHRYYALAAVEAPERADLSAKAALTASRAGVALPPR